MWWTLMWGVQQRSPALNTSHVTTLVIITRLPWRLKLKTTMCDVQSGIVKLEILYFSFLMQDQHSFNKFEMTLHQKAHIKLFQIECRFVQCSSRRAAHFPFLCHLITYWIMTNSWFSNSCYMLRIPLKFSFMKNRNGKIDFEIFLFKIWPSMPLDFSKIINKNLYNGVTIFKKYVSLTFIKVSNQTP